MLLQSSTNENGLKYDMRVIAQNVEYFDLMRDQGALNDCPAQSSPESPSDGNSPLSGLHADRGLRDSLWYFDGESVRCWMDVEDLLKSASTENDRELPQPVTTASDFYPTSIVLDRGLVLGLDAEMIQRRDVHFAYLRHTIRVCFCPFQFRTSHMADQSRHNYSFPIFYADIYLNSILLQLLSLLFVIRNCHTFLMHSRSFFIWFSMTKLMRTLTAMIL